MNKTVILAALLAVILNANPVSAGPEEGLFNAAKTMIANAQTLPSDEKLSSYRSAKELLDLIGSAYGDSEIGQDLVSGGIVQGVDIDALNKALASGETDDATPVLVDLGNTIVTASNAPEPNLSKDAEPADASSSGATSTESFNLAPLARIDNAGQLTPVAPSSPAKTDDVLAGLPNTPTTAVPNAENTPQEGAPFSAEINEALAVELGSEATESAMELKKQDIRDIQARLLVMGHDPNGIDGQIGRGTRGALGDWQQLNGVEPTGYLSVSQKVLLQQQSEPLLVVWLQNPENARTYDPPVIALSPGNMSGNWRFTSNCGRNSKIGKMKITGAIAMTHAGGNNYVGNVRQSRGLRGKINARLNGRQFAGEINWGLLIGRTKFSGRVADERLAISGTDSDRCSFYARKS